LTTSPPTDLMTTSSQEPASAGGRDHRNPWPASIGTGGRLRSESTADFVGMRTHYCALANEFAVLRYTATSGQDVKEWDFTDLMPGLFVSCCHKRRISSAAWPVGFNSVTPCPLPIAS
jgi:hypothetical protein